MTAAGLDSPIIWLDVEQVPHYEWSTSTAANAEVVLGAAQGYADAGYRVGVYSTPAIWAGSSATSAWACRNGEPPARPRRRRR